MVPTTPNQNNLYNRHSKVSRDRLSSYLWFHVTWKSLRLTESLKCYLSTFCHQLTSTNVSHLLIVALIGSSVDNGYIYPQTKFLSQFSKIALYVLYINIYYQILHNIYRSYPIHGGVPQGSIRSHLQSHTPTIKPSYEPTLIQSKHHIQSKNIFYQLKAGPESGGSNSIGIKSSM